MTRDLPDIVRIKRKRHQDSLQALILEAPRNKRIKDEAYVFKLQRTEKEIGSLSTDGTEALPLLQQSSHKDDKNNTYVIPKEHHTEELPEELNEMLSSILVSDPAEAETKPLKKRKQRNTAGSFLSKETVDLEYVYDVYYRDKAVAESWETDKVGYIKFEEDYEDIINDDDSEKHVSDDEDSNAEDFYKNDYPEDEDDHTIDIDSSDAELEQLTESLHKEASVKSPKLQEGFDELYDEFYDDINGDSNADFLASLNQDDEGEDDDAMEYESDESEQYKRQNFFPDEEDDELAKHRDKIFGKLQKMINEHN